MGVGRTLAAGFVFVLALGIADSRLSTHIREIAPSPSFQDREQGFSTSATSTRNKNETEDSVNVNPNGLNSTRDLFHLAQGFHQNSTMANPKDGSITNASHKEDCRLSTMRCMDKSVIACFRHAENGSNKSVLMVENVGDETLRVNISAPYFVTEHLELPKHKIWKMNFTRNGNSVVNLQADKWECLLHTDLPGTQKNVLVYMPAYRSFIKPITGSYIFLIAMLVFGGTWICIMLMKKTRSGNAYQELELGVSDSGLANGTESAERWDLSWDNAWEEENVTMSSKTHGARPEGRDHWVNDWES